MNWKVTFNWFSGFKNRFTGGGEQIKRQKTVKVGARINTKWGPGILVNGNLGIDLDDPKLGPEGLPHRCVVCVNIDDLEPKDIQ